MYFFHVAHSRSRKEQHILYKHDARPKPFKASINPIDLFALYRVSRRVQEQQPEITAETDTMVSENGHGTTAAHGDRPHPLISAIVLAPAGPSKADARNHQAAAITTRGNWN
jgi:hypothetical protein